MPLKTFEEYVESLRDGRVVYFDGKRVPDVTQHPYFRKAIERAGTDYKLAHDPRFRDLFLDKDEAGNDVYFVYKKMKNSRDLLRKRAIIQFLLRMGGFGSRFTGIDAIQALCAVTKIMDEDLGTDYNSRMEKYRRYFMENDLAIALAMTDVKGNRRLRPWEQEQHKDFYLRVVERRSDGVVVRGAKAHISFAPIVNELLVMPTRAMPDPKGKDYTIAFTIPVNAKGIILVNPEPPEGEEYFPTDCLVIFDDVFVPEDRIFLNGEWQYSGMFARMFANFHRLSAGAYKTVEIERIVGAAKLMEEYNGLEGVGHVREKLAWLAWWYTTVESLNRAACERCIYDKRADMAYPNPILANAAKYMYAEFYHQAIKYVQDIAGGIVATMPSFKDYENPEIRPYIEKYLAGKAGVPTAHRLAAIKLVQKLSSSRSEVTTIHAEGSLQMQLLEIYFSFDWERVKNTAKMAAGINPEEEGRKWIEYAIKDVKETTGIELKI